MNNLIAMWQEVGVGIVRDGGFQFCLPDYLQPVVDMVVGRDPESSGGTLTPLRLFAFGTIHAWHGLLGRCRIDVLKKDLITHIRKTRTERDFLAKNGPGGEIVSSLSGIEHACGSFDEDVGYSLDRAIASWGSVRRGECCGYFPAPGLGGAPLLKHLRRIRALEHFAIIADLGVYRWFNASGGTSTYERDVQRPTQRVIALTPFPIAMWQEVGVGIMRGARFHSCLPHHLQPIVEMVAGRVPELSNDTLTPSAVEAHWNGRPASAVDRVARTDHHRHDEPGTCRRVYHPELVAVLAIAHV